MDDKAMKDPNAMTVEECRDWLYRAKALLDLVPGHGHDMTWAEQHWDEAHCRRIDQLDMHPIPDTLDSAAKLPDGWWVRIQQLQPSASDNSPMWVADGFHNKLGKVSVHGTTEKEARFRLRVAVERLARQGEGGGHAHP